ncbi:MAG: hypothetical protein PHW74_13010, partial [Desulfobacca sp.]|nr:hypothetical protein [Desulfobacca sp.]
MASGLRPIRVVALTPAGAHLARRLCQTLEGAVCWLPTSRSAAGVQTFDRLADVFGEAFAQGHSLVCIMAAGIVVRGVASHLKGKDRDPAVVVVDEKGRFAVSLLSGHLGGANDLARQVAQVLGGVPVITTATDVQGLPALDALASFGFLKFIFWGFRGFLRVALKKDYQISLVKTAKNSKNIALIF